MKSIDFPIETKEGLNDFVVKALRLDSTSNGSNKNTGTFLGSEFLQKRAKEPKNEAIYDSIIDDIINKTR
jgi:hypothetical protein